MDAALPLLKSDRWLFISIENNYMSYFIATHPTFTSERPSSLREERGRAS